MDKAHELIKGTNTTPLDEKIAIVEGGYKNKDTDKIFGITPEDYNIFKNLGKIDDCGNAQSENHSHKPHYDSDQSSSDLSNNDELTADEVFDKMVADITDKIIISHKSTFYRTEQALICLLSVFGGYFYIFLACFGNEPFEEDYIISNK